MKQNLPIRITTMALLLSVSLFSTQLDAQNIEAECGVAVCPGGGWVEDFGPYTGASFVWSERTSGGFTGRKSGGSSATRVRGRYILPASIGITPGLYNNITLGWYNENNADATQQLWFLIGARNCPGTTTTVCNSGTFGVNDNWFSPAAPAVAGPHTQTYSNVTINASDTIFMFIKTPTSSNAAWFDYMSFSVVTGTTTNTDFGGNINVFPNPASKQVTIESKGQDLSGAKVKISNVYGAVILDIDYTNNLNVSKLEPGIYTLMITQGNKIAIKKLVIE